MARNTHPRGYTVRRIHGDILTARPEGMDYETYRQKRKERQRMLRDRLRGGFMVWKSKSIDPLKGESWGTLVGRVPAIQFTD